MTQTPNTEQNLQPPRRFLVISPTGASQSRHSQWIIGPRSFDLLLVNYGSVPDRYREDCELYYQMSGFKLEIVAAAINAWRDQIGRYEAVWIPDDDLAIETEEINRLFEIHQQYGLDLSQPAVTGYLYHPPTKKQPNSVLRFTNFIEMMCPLFSTAVLFEVLELFTLNRSGFGIDWLWSKRLEGRRLAVIDVVSVEHTKPISEDGPYYVALRERGIDAKQEYLRLMFEHDLAEEYEELGRIHPATPDE